MLPVIVPAGVVEELASEVEQCRGRAGSPSISRDCVVVSPSGKETPFTIDALLRQGMRPGVFLFAGQFVFLFYAMEAGLPPGLVSVLIQLQGPLTLVLAALFLRERATPGQWLGLGVAMIGVMLIALLGRRQRQPVRRRHCAAVGAELGGGQSLPVRNPRSAPPCSR